ncbi:MAG TPA: molecular chaperone DnaJ [Actinomycetota bacterium]|jgi:molecular chaperone DnaJ|nr:molecular chaperone DnaJ [Actinomycetota bacterium]
MTQARDLYQVLGVPPEASAEDIKRAYRKLARQYHPDVSEDPEADRRFKEISLAYQTLSDPAKRRQYDMFGGEGLTPDMFGFGPDLADLFGAFFGGSFTQTRTRGRPTRSRRGADLHTVLDLTFEEAAFGTQKEVQVKSLEECARCGGNGCEPGTFPSRCTRCGGTGEISDVRRSVFGTVMTSRTCGTCEGTGEEIASPCKDCGGEGRVRRAQAVSVDIPAGVQDGMELRVQAGGEQGRHGGLAGDLYLTLRVTPHPLFERRGEDLFCTLEVPVTQALLGATVELPTLDGPQPLTIPPGARPNTLLRLRGRGIPHLRRRGRGDLYVEVAVVVPEELPKKERKLVEELARIRGELPGTAPLPGRLRRRD